LYRRLRYGYAFRLIPLTQGKFAIVDPDDYARLSKLKWYAGGRGKLLYAKHTQKTNGKIEALLMHREVISVPDNMQVDHINHNGLDNRKANLRPVTPLQNMWNIRRKRGLSGFKGVTWDKREKKWKVQLPNKCKNVNIGCFDDPVEAAKAYDETVKKYRGQFAVLNFPPESTPAAQAGNLRSGS
jgi:hypothetical protein